MYIVLTVPACMHTCESLSHGHCVSVTARHSVACSMCMLQMACVSVVTQLAVSLLQCILRACNRVHMRCVASALVHMQRDESML
jgi:hypothetical protein